MAVLAVDLSCIEPSLESLSPEEKARARRFVVPGPAEQFVRSRVFLRSVLGRILRVDVRSLEFSFGVHGKPYLSDTSGVEFNLSHSGDWAALAVARHGPLGVDVEISDPTRRLLQLGRRFFSDREVLWFEQLQGAARIEAFYRLWTLKEAYLKALGSGLTFSSRRFSFTLGGAGGARLLQTDWPGDHPRHWRFHETTVPTELASTGPPVRLALCRPTEPADVEYVWGWAAVQRWSI